MQDLKENLGMQLLMEKVGMQELEDVEMQLQKEKLGMQELKEKWKCRS